jgi:hypothetical protein
MSGYIGSKASVVSSGVERKKTYSITGSTTSLTGLNYTVGKVHVYQNGVRLLDGTDYTATNGTSITLTVAAQSGDNVVVVSQASFQLSESYTSTEADAEFVTKTGDTMSGNLNVTGTVTSDGLTVDGTDLAVSFNGSSKTFVYLTEGDTTDLNTKIYQSGGNFGIQTIADDLATSKNRLKVDHSTGDISFYEDTGTTAKFFWDASAESLGIGTTTPTGKLHLKGAGQAFRIEDTVSGNLQFGQWDGSTNRIQSSGRQFKLMTSDAQPITLFTNNAERMRIDSSGNVGIGTTSPSSPKFSSSASGVLELKGSKPSFNVQESDVTDAHFNMSMSAGNAILGATGTGNLIFATGTSTWSERMRIDSSGRLGIGTSSPSEKLHVNSGGGNVPALFESTDTVSIITFKDNNTTTDVGVGADDNNLVFYIGSERMRIDASGRVTTPSQPMFHATQSSAQSVGQDVKLAFNGTDINVGSHFSTSSDRFTAPISGRYFFSFNGSINNMSSTGQYLAVYFRTNGNGTLHRFRTRAENVGGEWTGIQGTSIFNLSSGDYVEVFAYNHTGTFQFQGGEHHFSGYLIG